MDFLTSLNIYRFLIGGAPGRSRVLRFNGGPIAADPFIIPCAGVRASRLRYPARTGFHAVWKEVISSRLCRACLDLCSETDTGVPVDLTNCASLRKAARRDGRRNVRRVLNCDSLSATDTEALDEVLVARLVLGLGVVKEFPALGDELQKATPGVVVLLVGLEVLGQRRDPRGQDRHLDIGRAGIAVLRREFLDDLRLFFSRYRHRGLLFWVMAQAGMSSSAAHGAKPGV